MINCFAVESKGCFKVIFNNKIRSTCAFFLYFEFIAFFQIVLSNHTAFRQDLRSIEWLVRLFVLDPMMFVCMRILLWDKQSCLAIIFVSIFMLFNIRAVIPAGPIFSVASFWYYNGLLDAYCDSHYKYPLRGSFQQDIYKLICSSTSLGTQV